MMHVSFYFGYNFIMSNPASVFIILVSVIATLIYGQSLIIPFIFSLLLWFLSRKLRTTLDKIKPIKQYTPYWLKNVLSSLIILGILIIISKILSTNINVLLTASKQYDTNISAAIDLLSQYVNGDIYTTLKNQVGNINIAKILSLIVNSITGLFGNMIMIIVYLLFIFGRGSFLQ